MISRVSTTALLNLLKTRVETVLIERIPEEATIQALRH